MYIGTKNGMPEHYETLDELLAEPITLFTEYEDYYYIQVKSNMKFHEGTIWQVNKKTEEVSYFNGFAGYILADLPNKAKPVDVEKFKSKRVKKSS